MNDSSMNEEFRVDQLDHVEFFVPNRKEAADWYRRVLGFVIVEEYKHWASDPQGPLMISSDNGSTKLALFEGVAQGSRETAGFHLVAFRVGADDFFRFLNLLPGLNLLNHRGLTVTFDSIVDHSTAYSIYFCDPYGHRLELTTYEYENVCRQLSER